MPTKQEILNHENLTAFRQHGFRPKDKSGNQIYGNCIFCEHDDHFYINPLTKMWDCKVCGLSGGYKTFIDEVIKLGIESFTFKDQKELSAKRGLKIRTLKKFNVGYNPHINAHIIPTYEIVNKDDVYGLKIFPLKKTKRATTAGGKAGCLGWQDLPDNTIQEWWIVEGEWDYFSWYEVLDGMKLNHGCLGLPMATGFKDDFTNYFKNKTVHVLLDNDADIQLKTKIQFGAGIQGMIKIYNKLSTVTKKIDFIHWPSDLPDGYDVNDCYKSFKSDARQTFDFVNKLLRQYPPKMKIGGDEKPVMASSPANVQPNFENRYTGNGIDYRDVHAVFNKWLKLERNDLIDITFGCIIGNRLPGDPVWLQIVGPSGCAKSVMLMSIDNHFDIEAIDTLTPATLISGSTTAGGGDPSLLPKLHNRILVIKDLTTILEMQAAFRNEIFGIFRSAYDGKYSKPFGNGMMTRSGKSKFGFITGVTEAIELYTEGDTALGTRFLRFNVPVGNIHSILKQIDKNLENEFETNASMRNELMDTARKVIDFNYDLKSIVIDDSILERTRFQSIVIEMLRGTVPTDRFTKEITHRAIKALPTRSYVQLLKLLKGMMLFKKLKQPDDDCLRIIKDTAIGTIPLAREHILSLMYARKGESTSIPQLSTMIRLPSVVCQRTIDKLVALDVVEKISGSTMMKPFYRLTGKVNEAIEKGGLYCD